MERFKSYFKEYVKPYLICTVFGALISIIVLLALAPVIYLLQLPVGAAGPMALFAEGVGAFFSGLLMGKVRQKHGLVIGAKSGLILCSLLFLGGAIFGGLSGKYAAAKILVAIITGCTGGVIGVNGRERE